MNFDLFNVHNDDETPMHICVEDFASAESPLTLPPKVAEGYHTDMSSQKFGIVRSKSCDVAYTLDPAESESGETQRSTPGIFTRWVTDNI
jgi:hypothetical protein